MSLGQPAWPEARQVIQKLLSKNEASVIRADRGMYFISLSFSLSLSHFPSHQHSPSSPPLAITLSFDRGIDDFRKIII